MNNTKNIECCSFSLAQRGNSSPTARARPSTAPAHSRPNSRRALPAPRPQPGPGPAILYPAWAKSGPNDGDRRIESDGCPRLSTDHNRPAGRSPETLIPFVPAPSSLSIEQRQLPSPMGGRPAPVRDCRRSKTGSPSSFSFPPPLFFFLPPPASETMEQQLLAPVAARRRKWWHRRQSPCRRAHSP